MDMAQWRVPVLYTTLTALAVCAMTAVCAGGEPTECGGWTACEGVGDDTDTLARLGRLPAWVDAVVHVRDVSATLKSPGGALFAEDLRESLLLAGTQEAWARLSRILGWSSDVAFDRLLGGRMLLVGTGVGEPATAQWVIVSDVTIETEKHLHKSLRTAPRGAIAAQTVLALEDGDVELAVVRGRGSGVAQRGGQAARVSTIVLTRGGRTPLFTAVIEGLAGRAEGETLSETSAFRGVESMGIGDAVVILQSAMVPDAPVDRRFLAVSATHDTADIRASLRASPSVFGMREFLEPARVAWSDAPLRSLRPDALLLIMGVGAESVGELGELTGVPGVDEAIGEPVRRLMSRRWLVGLHGWSKPGGAEARLALTVGLETPAVAEFAHEADGVMGRIVETINGHGLQHVRKSGPNFRGAMPMATRKAVLNGPMMSTWEPAFGDSPLLTWAARPCAGEPPLEDADSCGWWVATVTPNAGQPPRAALGAEVPTDWARFVVDVLAVPGDGETKARVSLGYAAVSRLARWVSRVQGDPAGVLVAVRSMESVMWEAWLGDDRTVEGRVVVTVRRRAE